MKRARSSEGDTPARIEFSLADIDRYSNGDCVRSPLEMAGWGGFILKIFPRGTKGAGSRYVSVFVEMLGDFTAREDWSFPDVGYTITAINNNPKKNSTKEEAFTFNADVTDRGWHDFLKYDRLKAEGWLSAAGELRFQASVSGDSLWDAQRDENTMGGRLWKQRRFTDLLVLTGDLATEIPCHRAVLAAESPVFEAMLGSEMKEGSSGKVIVKDSSERALHLMLEHLYTGTFSSIPDADEVLELMGLGDLYNLRKLQADCARQLVARISPANVVQVWSMFQRCAGTEKVKEQLDRLREKIHENKQLVDAFLNP